MLLDGIKVNTSPSDYFPLEELQMRRFNGEVWELFGPIMSGASSHATLGARSPQSRSLISTRVVIGRAAVAGGHSAPTVIQGQNRAPAAGC